MCGGRDGELWVAGPNVMLGYRNAPDEEPSRRTAGCAPVTSPA